MPLIGAAAFLFALKPITLPVGLILLAHAWIIPELYASRGAGVLRRRPGGDPRSERRAIGLLADLLSHRPRELLAHTGLVLERGELGVWLLGEAGALLIGDGARRVYCYCVRVPGDDLPAADRIAHLLLALRADEIGFATVANLAFAGAPWRLHRRLRGPARNALDAALALIRASSGGETRPAAGSSVL